jgi:hypothetical protein
MLDDKYRPRTMEELEGDPTRRTLISEPVPPDNVGVLVPPGDDDSQLEIAMRSLPKYRVTKLMSTATRLAHGTFKQMCEIEVQLWR